MARKTATASASKNGKELNQSHDDEKARYRLSQTSSAIVDEKARYRLPQQPLESTTTSHYANPTIMTLSHNIMDLTAERNEWTEQQQPELPQQPTTSKTKSKTKKKSKKVSNSNSNISNTNDDTVNMQTTVMMATTNSNQNQSTTPPPTSPLSSPRTSTNSSSIKKRQRQDLPPGVQVGAVHVAGRPGYNDDSSSSDGSWVVDERPRHQDVEQPPPINRHINVATTIQGPPLTPHDNLHHKDADEESDAGTHYKEENEEDPEMALQNKKQDRKRRYMFIAAVVALAMVLIILVAVVVGILLGGSSSSGSNDASMDTGGTDIPEPGTAECESDPSCRLNPAHKESGYQAEPDVFVQDEEPTLSPTPSPTVNSTVNLKEVTVNFQDFEDGAGVWDVSSNAVERVDFPAWAFQSTWSIRMEDGSGSSSLARQAAQSVESVQFPVRDLLSLQVSFDFKSQNLANGERLLLEFSHTGNDNDWSIKEQYTFGQDFWTANGPSIGYCCRQVNFDMENQSASYFRIRFRMVTITGVTDRKIFLDNIHIKGYTVDNGD